MKELVILLEDKETDYQVGRFIKENLRMVLEDAVNIHISFLSEMERFRFNDMDLILVMVPTLLYKINSHIHQQYAPEKFLLVTRTLSQKALSAVQQIPQGSRVLVCNRTPETTAELLRNLYELEVIHLDLEVFRHGMDPNAFSYVITTSNNKQLQGCTVPMIDIGYRQLGIQAFLDIFSRLNITDLKLKANLTQYIYNLPAKYNDVGKRYYEAGMIIQILEKVMEKADFGVLVTGIDRKILYYNKKTVQIFGSEVISKEYLELRDNQEASDLIYSSNFDHGLVQIGREYVMFDRYPLVMNNTPMSYFFECQTAKNINEMDSRLRAQLKASGFCTHYTFDNIVYQSDKMKESLSIAQKLAVTDYPILISGESGVGKELFAQSIHNASHRTNGPFVAINCAAMPESLLESELFGYENGAFTGSRKGGKIGLLELANKGSIFLDEIGDMPLFLQAKLLRVLQEKKIMRLGSDRIINIDIRILSATNKKLMSQIEKNQFRADLYYRLSTFVIDIPPLRMRKEDIIPLFYIFSKRNQKLTPEEERQLIAYPWPGNVRELQNTAAYYDMIGNIRTIGHTMIEQPVIVPESREEKKILELLGRYPEGGIGRSRLIALMDEEGIHISQKNAEKLIKQLLDKQMIVRGKGRQGIRLANI